MRASTLSLGSIAFGSLIVTLLELVKMVLNAAKNSANADGHRTYPSFVQRFLAASVGADIDATT